MLSVNWSQAVLPENWQVAGFGLYIHWPFCQAKCPYCDFNSHVAVSVDQDRWQNAFLSELHRVAASTPGRILSSVFFGGGTPSLMDPRLVSSILETVLSVWSPANDIEITLEANPTSVESRRFEGYRKAGVNRVSLGVQSLRDDDLRSLGRLHNVEEARTAINIARANFDRVSFDLIYARQHQLLDAWRNELDEALLLEPDHLSLYQLTIEPGTAFGARHTKGLLAGLPEEDLAADMYFETQAQCEAAGLPAYETSNHARPGQESRHNFIYWRGGDYLGIGPGAHGRVTLDGTRYATETPLGPNEWLSQVEKTGSGESLQTALPLEDQAVEYALMGLRLREGIDRARFENLGGRFHPDAVQNFVELGLLDITPQSYRVTKEGQPLLNALLRDLL